MFICFICIQQFRNALLVNARQIRSEITMDNTFKIKTNTPNKIMTMNSVNSYVNHSLNNSKGKAAFSFPRSQRQEPGKKIINHSFYELPSMRSNRACSLGYGSKADLCLKSNSPPPNAYKIADQFNGRHNEISFGLDRNSIKFGYFFDSIEKTKKFPAPNAYRMNQSCFSKRGGKIGSRLKTQLDYIANKKTPGPGAYELKHTDIKDSGQYILSSFRNELSPRYHNPEHVRQKQSINARLTTVGPGSYNTSNKQFGKSLISQFRNSVASSFSKSERQGVVDKFKVKVPGFKYNSFSQFGAMRL